MGRPSRLDKTTILLQTAIGVFKIGLGLGGCPYIIASSRELGNLGDLGETLQHACHRGTVANHKSTVYIDEMALQLSR